MLEYITKNMINSDPTTAFAVKSITIHERFDHTSLINDIADNKTVETN